MLFFRNLVHGFVETDDITNLEADAITFGEVETDDTGFITDDTLEETARLIVLLSVLGDDFDFDDLADESGVVVSGFKSSDLDCRSGFNGLARSRGINWGRHDASESAVAKRAIVWIEFSFSCWK